MLDTLNRLRMECLLTTSLEEFGLQGAPGALQHRMSTIFEQWLSPVEGNDSWSVSGKAFTASIDVVFNGGYMCTR